MRSSTSVLAIVLTSASYVACFNPSLDNKFCGAGDVCPAGYTCDVARDTCVKDTSSCGAPPCTATVADFSVVVNRDLDLLFVIDNSPDAVEEQNALINGIGTFIDSLRQTQDGLPNLHVGVVSTDLGVGSDALPTCDVNGDAGTLQNTPRGGCEAPNGQFIIDVAAVGGGRTTNYTGELADAFTCIARLGQTGCGFEQPLEAMKRALDGSNPLNTGFLREDAYLAVLFVTNEDDCSTRDLGMFSAVETPELGPVSGFRCFEFGVECTPDMPRTVGDKQACGARTNSPYMYDVAEYETFLKSLKADPNQVIVSAFLGSVNPVNVELSDGYFRLAPSCISALGDAQPPIRMANFLSLFPQRSALASVCSADFANALASIGGLMANVINREQCVDGDIDRNPSLEGVQHECEVVRIVGTSEAVIPECPTVPPQVDATPCWYLQASDVCPAPSASAVVVEWGGSRPSNEARINVRCDVN